MRSRFLLVSALLALVVSLAFRQAPGAATNVHVYASLSSGGTAETSTACADAASGGTARYLNANVVGGSNNGTSWANAWSSLSSALAGLSRNQTLCVADGAYAGGVLSTANSGTTTITIKKATVFDHGSSTGWSNTMGDGTATFSSQVRFTSDYWVFDGAMGGGPGNWENTYGFQVTETGANNAVILIGGGASTGTRNNITVRHTHLVGMNGSGTGGGGSGNDGFATGDGNGGGGCTNCTLSYNWIENVGRCPVFDIGNVNLIVEFTNFGEYQFGAVAHAEVASIQATPGDHTYRYNLFRHSRSTGGLMWDNHQNTSANIYVYGNVIYHPAGVFWDDENGFLGGWTGGGGEDCRNYHVYNNTFILVSYLPLGNFPIRFSGNDVKNNLFYTGASPDFTIFPTHDYNHFIASGGTHSEANGTSAASGDPFVDYVNLDFRLTGNTTAGVNLGAPYNVDLCGHTRTTWTRGAIEYTGGTC